MKYTAVIFDLDGTLLDTLDDLADSMNAALARLNMPVHPVDSYRYFVGNGVVVLAQEAMPEHLRHDKELLAQLLMAMREEYQQRWSAKTHPYPGVPEMLDALTANGVRMAVLSNKPDEFTQKMVSSLLSRWKFDAIMGQRADIPRKPDPAGALLLAKSLGVSPNACLYLGDSGTDMTTACSADMFAVGALWGFRTAEELETHGAKALVQTPQDVLKLLL